jgi:glucose-6-phosphate isomerase/transaldolase/glucose-6-phosphate isomerase
MGGSSLAPEVLRQIFGRRRGWPRLHVLDSTVPAWVERVAGAVDPSRTLYIVSSKSGSTIEVTAFFRYFFDLARHTVGERAGEHFLAITDPGTGLEQLARQNRFLQIFLNPPDIGGRFSALSLFGLVPAVLGGIDPSPLLAPVAPMAAACAPATALAENPGAVLGAWLAAAHRTGRDKVTLLTSPRLSPFGLWAEQLLAESTGKEGRGLLPVALEPEAPPQCYGPDRLFICLRLQGDCNCGLEARVASLQQAGHPLLHLELPEVGAVGAEFYRWEFATAVAGALMGIQPFDQPNVQESKDLTAGLLRQAIEDGHSPDLASQGDFAALLALARAGDYFALMAYLADTPEIDRALQALRLALIERFHLATTLGYGPRFLHSTGQYHKGGPPTGLFVQFTAEHTHDLQVPGEGYTFGTLAAAQAEGDFRALAQRGRRIIRIPLGRDPARRLSDLATAVRQA